MHTPCILLFLCAALPVQAAEVRLSFAEIPRHAVAHNPELAAARWRVEEERGRLLGAGRPANPELGFEFKNSHDLREGAVAISLDQKFPLTARLQLEKALSAQLVEAAELEVRNAERQLIAEVQTLAVELLSLENQKVLRQQLLEIATTLSQFASDRSATGEISPLDAAQAQVDSQRLVLEIRRLETERISLLGKVKPKLGLNASDTLVLSGGLPAAGMPGTAAWERRPDFQLARLKEDVARRAIDLARARMWEDINVGVVVEGERVEDAPDGLENTGYVGFRISLPLPFWNKNEGEIAEKAAGAQRALAETRALASNISNEAAAAREEMAAHLQLAIETRDNLLPLVLEHTGRLEMAYQTGQADLLTVLRAREQHLQIESAVLDATRDFHLAQIRYEAATGHYSPAQSK
ncbi:TolC family protein [soil metagenome]